MASFYLQGPAIVRSFALSASSNGIFIVLLLLTLFLHFHWLLASNDVIIGVCRISCDDSASWTSGVGTSIS